jgi:CheY-like chemotaxis protein
MCGDFMATILIVDDDAELRSIYRQTLERQGYSVTEAEDGVDAINQINANKPDVLILDMMMPRMAGSSVLKMLAENDTLSSIRRVVITAYPNYRDTALSYDVDQFLVKPVRPSDIVNAVKTALD